MSEENVNFAYKSIPVSDGVAFMFDKIDYEGFDSPKMQHSDTDIFLSYGKNVALLSPPIIEMLLATPRVFFYEANFEDYYAGKLAGTADIDPLFLAKVSGAIEMLVSKTT